jgi:hypothetical protein
MAVNEKQLGDALQEIAEQFHAIDKSLAKIAVGLFALKAIVALQVNPSAPSQALKMIQDFENEIAKLDPSRSERERVAEVLEILKLIDKHGGPKQA